MPRQAHELPAAASSGHAAGHAAGHANLPHVFTDTALDQLEDSWEQQKSAEAKREAKERSLPAGRATASRTVHALVDRRFLYLGRHME